MPKNLFPLDNSKKFKDQKIVGHNRWHPDIPAAVHVKPGDTFRADCREWFDGAIKNDDSAEDLRHAPLPGVHVLSGPFHVEGAEPGDLLIVDILEIDSCDQEDSGPFSGMGWGYTGVFATKNGGSFLTERFPDAYKVIWDFNGDVATSRHIPEVSYVGIHHPGLMGTAPSAELLAKWTAREKALIATDPMRVPPLALPPLPDSAILGSLSGAEFTRVAGEGARTAPPRENGGNQDIKNLTAGSRIFYPVFVPGAKLSFGDLHFSQGDGEITFCGAIEMGGFMDLHVDLIKGGMTKYGIKENAMFMPGLRDPQYSEWMAFSGVSVHPNGKQHYLDSWLAYQNACNHAIDYLMKFGYTDIQAYMILGTAPVEGRLSGVVDIPNACSTIYLPRAIFDFDIRPSAKGPGTKSSKDCKCRVRPIEAPSTTSRSTPAPSRCDGAGVPMNYDPASESQEKGNVMLLGMALFWVGAVLFLNGIWLLGKIGDNEIGVIDVFVGFVTLAVALYWAFGPNADLASVKAATLTLLFTFTYFWVAWNRWNKADGRGLGWFCLFVAITTVPVFLQGFHDASTTWDVWFAICWLSWGVLWFLFFLILALGRTSLTQVTGGLCALQGIYTAWLPGFLLLSGILK